jgi:hypothetical protein
MGLRFTKGNENGVPQVSPFLRDLGIGLPAGARLPTSRKRGVMWSTPDFLSIAGRRGAHAKREMPADMYERGVEMLRAGAASPELNEGEHGSQAIGFVQAG